MAAAETSNEIGIIQIPISFRNNSLAKSNSNSIRIANGAGFLGDQLAAPAQVVETGEADILTLEYLAELTLSILAHVKKKNSQAGYANDFIRVLPSLLPALQRQSNLKIITNAGGVNPIACAEAVAKILRQADMSDLMIGVVDGDDLLSHWRELRAGGEEFKNLETGELLCASADVSCANAYLGAEPIVQALQQNARIIITGRVADASLTVAPCVHYFSWDWSDWHRLAGATVAGHIIECGAQATGGYSTSWRNLRLTDVGYPITEITSQGDCTIYKPKNSGGAVTRQTVVEQLVYEIGDPKAYVTPDVVADFTSVCVNETSDGRVSITGAHGEPAPDSYKVSLATHAGYTASATLVMVGDDLQVKAQYCADMVFARVARAGFALEHTHFELLGGGDGLPNSTTKSPVREAVLRLAVRASQREAVERFTAEIAPLITSGPAGLAGYAQPRAVVRPAFSYWPTTVSKEKITPRVQVKPAADW